MSYHDIKLRKADVLFSRWIREKRGNKCERCGKLGVVGGVRVAQLEASHYYSRSHNSTRYSQVNVRVLCFLCHKRMGGHTKNEDGEYDLWMKELLGEKAYAELRVAANTYAKRDDAMALLYVKELMKGTEGGGRMKPKPKPKPKGC